MSTWDDVDLNAFYRGEDPECWRWMGARPGADGVDFRVFAPGARNVSVLTGGRELPMARALNGCFFEAHVPGARVGDAYEYRVQGADGSRRDHADPFALASELRPQHRSVVSDVLSHPARCVTGRDACFDRPMSIYEVHAGSWRKPGGANAEPDAWYTYDELADRLVPYVRELGCTHVEFLPLAEHPFDGSWGYQVSGPFSPTRRYGERGQLVALVDRLHEAGVGTILDFVPVHFATDAWALANFDGTALYEYPNDAVGVSEWGSHNFMHSRGEVRSLLLSAADLWLGVYGFDGLRLDAVSRIVYWQGDESRGVNGMGVGFLRTFCDVLHARHPGCVLIAEDSSSFPGITRPTAEGGLGFDYKWDLGWMHDTLSYFQAPPEERRNVPGRLTFSMMYYGDERYLLPLSHDEVVHGKATIAQKMNGGYERKFPQARALYLYMVAHPGKTLDFMGNEFAQLREWDETREQDWCLLDFPVHDAFLRFRRELGAAYRAHPALWERDYERDGFTWLDCEQREPCCWAILRSGGGECVAALLNFDDEAHAYEVPLPAELSGCEVEVLLDTDWQRFGGSTPDGTTVCAARGKILTAEIPPLSGMLVLLA